MVQELCVSCTACGSPIDVRNGKAVRQLRTGALHLTGVQSTAALQSSAAMRRVWIQCAPNRLSTLHLTGLTVGRRSAG